MKVKQMTVTCDGCGAVENMIFEKDSLGSGGRFKLPTLWRYRHRSFRLDNLPQEMQVACSMTCAEKVEKPEEKADAV